MKEMVMEAMFGMTGSVDQTSRIFLWSSLSNLSTKNWLIPRSFSSCSKFKLNTTIKLPVDRSTTQSFSFSLLPSPSLASSSMADSDSRISARSGENGTIEGNGSIEPSCTEIIIVRHGETDWNAQSKMQGQLDVELNELGRQQAFAVADRLSREMTNISAVYSSDLKRALVTAEIIATKCGGLEVIRDKDFRERHLGDLQGLVYHDLKLNPKAYAAFKSLRSGQEIPGGGESRDQVYNRCTSALQRIHEKHRGQQVVVVTHGGVIRLLYDRAAPNGPPGKKIMNTSVGVIQLSDGDLWSVKSWNDTSHLTETGFLKSGFGGDASSG